MSDYSAPRLPRRSRSRKHDDPKVIGLWKVGRVIGQGAQGRVRIARHSQTGQYAAVKIMSKASFHSALSMTRVEEDQEAALRSAEREIVMMKLIDHPNILRLLDLWVTETELYLVLEYAEGGELFDYLCERGKLPLPEATKYFQQIITAVEYCHRLNICHRDLKPENILLDRDFNVKIADFGMAVWQANGDAYLQTACGSPHYVAPEVISNQGYVGAAADVWSCGIILFALLCNRLPFEHEDTSTLLQLIQTGQYTFPSGIDLCGRDLVSRMLKADPSERITIPEIRSHPFFLSVPNPDLVSADAELDNLDRPLRSVDYIDPKIFANLQALWPDLSEETLIESLLSYEQSWAKGVYHRLVAHRERQQHDIAEEERVRRAMKLRARKPAHRTAKTGPGLPTPPRQESASSTLSPPYHDSARSSHDYKTDMTSPAADSAAACASSPVVPRDQQILTLPLTPTSPTPASPASAWTAEFDAAGAPSIEANEPEVAFFQQVFDKLNAMDVKAAHATRLLTPDPNSAYPYPTPVSAEFGIRCVANVPPPSPSDEWFGGFGLQLPLPTPGPSAKTSSIVPYIDPQPKHDGPEHIRPLVFRPGVRRPAPLILPGFAADKENVGQRPQAVAAEYDEVEEGHSAWIVVQSDEPPARTVLGEKRVFVGGDAGPPVPAKEAKMIGAGGLPTPLPTPTSPGPLSPGRLSWLGRNPFKPRPAVYELLSTRDAVATRDECLRLLVHMKIAVTVQRASRADPVGFLRCEVNEEHERVPVVFRVDVCRPSANHVAHGYAVAAHLVHERGAISSFKTLYNLLRRLWEFDNPVGILSPTIGSPASSPAKVRFG